MCVSVPADRRVEVVVPSSSTGSRLHSRSALARVDAALVAQVQHHQRLAFFLGQLVLRFLPAHQAGGDRVQLFLGGHLARVEVDLAGVIRRVGLRVAGLGGQDVRQVQRVADFCHRVGFARPVDQVVGQVDDAAASSARKRAAPCAARRGSLMKSIRCCGLAVVKVS